MIDMKKFKSMLLVCASAAALAACGGDSSTEIASPGNQGPNPGTGDGGNGGGNGGGGTVDTCPTGTSEVALGSGKACEIAGEILSDLTLTSENTYLLSGKVVVGGDVGADGSAGGAQATLTIESGTTVAGKDNTSYLVVSRGSKLIANGSSSAPIVMTSAADIERGSSAATDALSEGYTSEWGGLVVNGRATINGCDTGICEAAGEADSGNYGGDDDNDSSGTLRYLQVKYAGNPITSEDELNGIAFQGVGAGTTLDYIHVHNGADDGVEFFGGTAEIKHLIVTGADDDSLDWTKGWRGKAQHVLIMQNDNQSASDRGFEGDNNGSANDATPRAQPMISNVTLIGGNSVGDTGMVLRAGTGAKIWNAVVSGFRDDCLDIDDASTYAARDTADGITIESTLLGCESPTDNGSEDGDLRAWFEGQNNNVIGTTSLSGFFNGLEESKVVATDPSTIDSFFDSVNYIGAVKSSDASDNWTLGWSYGINPTPTCPDNTTDNGDGSCTLSGVYTGAMRLRAGLDYKLSGKVVIGEDLGPDAANPIAGAVSGSLTVDAGVKVMGENNTSFLVISRGSKIITNGRADAPVVFTSSNDATANLDTDTSLWGGLVINGRATINGCDTGICEAAGEADSGNYGGNDDDDDSGQLLYTVVKYAGNPITSEDELNGIAFQGVGRGTEVDYIQVHNGADDGVEFFGGTVNAKHVVVTGADDDSIDWTKGWRGMVQYAVVVQNANQSASDRGFEGDNNGSANDAAPRAQPIFSNVTLVGAEDGAGGDTGMVLRAGTGAKIMNLTAANWRDDCLDIDDASTYAARDTAEGITMTSVYLACTNNFDDGSEDGDLEAWFLGQANNSVGVSTLAAPNGGSRAYINGANETAVSVTNPAAVNSFFDSVNYIGAVKNSAGNWLQGWTVWIND
ncbi:hypothetical protein GCM10017044_09530 [Kordiimonas sediminis]|uniref:Lipoprotein n=1 Tax=Kordiimonas sediminis TaxID=1735581 RepID=A0A919E5Y2_9PROT|nr:hypothetical protein [Kordiimonas sediminis]GHF17254.1 hypothetical protein GCM10017044_09530 [Kordiimonas sediminis]